LLDHRFPLSLENCVGEEVSRARLRDLSPSPAPQRLQFGPFEFDVAAGELYRLGRRVRLQEQPRQVLAALLERPGEIATREELRERLWTTDTFVDFEHGLNTAIKKVRQALGDSAEAPEFIETLARRGYRFIAPVVPANATPTPAESPQAEPAVWDHPWLRLTLTSFLVVAITAGIVWVTQQGRGRPDPAPARQGAPAQLAVVPLRVLGGADGGDSSYIGVGIADAITTRLANIRQIGLRPTAATRRTGRQRAVAAAGGRYRLPLLSVVRAGHAARAGAA
jgi:DNA-binding winged helix-turn-helix (wHTH) protein